MSDGPTVIVVGVASRDVTADDPRGWRLGGGVSYTALTLARLGLRVGALIGADAEAATADELALLRDAGVQVVVAPLPLGPVFVNTETPTGRVQQVVEASDPMPPAATPEAWLAAPAWVFAPVAAELPDAWAEVPGADAAVAVGWQGLLRVLRRGHPVQRLSPGESAIVRRADLVGVGTDDIDPGTSLPALAALLRPGATLLVTNGVRGGIALDVGPDGGIAHERTWPSIPAFRSVDPTGAGDTFLAGVFAARVEPRLIGGRGGTWDLRLGAAAASLVCEAPGLLGVPGRTAVARRMADVTRAG